jgi:hypothetical protein
VKRNHSFGLLFFLPLIAAGLITYQVMANSIQSVHNSLPLVNSQVNSFVVLSRTHPGMHSDNPNFSSAASLPPDKTPVDPASGVAPVWMELMCANCHAEAMDAAGRYTPAMQPIGRPENHNLTLHD